MTWLRACRRVRLIVAELSWAVVAVAGAGAACGVCRAVWLIIDAAIERAGQK